MLSVNYQHNFADPDDASIQLDKFKMRYSIPPDAIASQLPGRPGVIRFTWDATATVSGGMIYGTAASFPTVLTSGGPTILADPAYFIRVVSSPSPVPVSVSSTPKGLTMTPTATKAPNELQLTPWQKVDFALQHARTILLYGPPGTGKSDSAHRQHLNGRAISTINFSEDGIGAKLEGLWKPGRDQWQYVFGQGAIAWMEGRRLIVDELDRGSPDQQTMMIRFLDAHQETQLTLPGGDSIRPKPEFQCVATMNQHPEMLEEALLDRFEAVIPITEPNPEAIARLPEELRAVALRTASDPDKKTRIGLRKWLAYAKFESIDIQAAAELVFGERAPDIIRDRKLAMAAKKLKKQDAKAEAK